ncbi:MAG: N-acetylmuramoyl-L-alanine amidase [Paludibacteraceae bacterium]|nr:N-acetylmuramoyl-L-alanine amidase [Paludibacteraceae bacterium]
MNDSLIGTLLIYTNHDRSGSRRLPTGEPRTVSAMLADSIMTQVVNDIRRSYCSIWPRRDLRNANYGETRDPEVPAVLLELLSHQNYADMRYALNPAFRQFVARAVYKGIGRFLARRYDTHFVPQPLTPTALHTVIDGDSLRLLWQPVKDSLEQEAVPSYYIVYVRENDGLWNEGIRVDSSAFAMPMAHGIRYDMCVAAGNEGGISLRSAVVSAFRASNNNRPMLVVDAFDEVRGPRMMAFDSLTGGIVPGARPVPDGYELAYIGEQINYNRRDPWRSDDDCGFGMCNMNRQGQLLVGNTHDYAVRHGKVLQTLHRSFVSCTADGLLPMDTAYTMVDIILGKSGAEHVRHINAVIQDNHWTEGDKRLIMSGAYVGTLSHACASGIVKMDNQSLLFSQELNTERLSAEDVSAVSPLAVSDTVIARYSDTMLPAGIRGENYTIFGFPLECLIEFEDIYSYWLQR